MSSDNLLEALWTLSSSHKTNTSSDQLPAEIQQYIITGEQCLLTGNFGCEDTKIREVPQSLEHYLHVKAGTRCSQYSQRQGTSVERLHPRRSCKCPAASPSPDSHHPDPENKKLFSIKQKLNGVILLAASRSYVDAEVSGGAAQRPAGCQDFGDVLQGEGIGEDPHGEADHQEAGGASEGPAVPWLDVRLQEEQVRHTHFIWWITNCV